MVFRWGFDSRNLPGKTGIKNCHSVCGKSGTWNLIPVTFSLCGFAALGDGGENDGNIVITTGSFCGFDHRFGLLVDIDIGTENIPDPVIREHIG